MGPLHIESLAFDATYPQVDVVIINSRGMENPWVQMAIGSVRANRYPNTGLIIVDNLDRSSTIGKCWNEAARQSDAHFVLYVGDDDYITYDLVSSLVMFYDYAKGQPNGAGSELVMVTTGCTAIDENGKTLMQMPKHHTGMYLRSWLLDHPFNEARQRFVDTEMHERILAVGKLRGKPLSLGMAHHYGYYYRQHIGQVSGQKVMKEPAAMPAMHKA